MNIQRRLYQGQKYFNDIKAVRRAVRTGSSKPITRRVGRRVYGKLTGRLARRIFG